MARNRLAAVAWGALGALLAWEVGAAEAGRPAEAPRRENAAGFTVAKETTRVLGPVRGDGTIDYVAALNEIYGRGVTAENNAAVVLLRVVGWGETGAAGKSLAQARAALGVPAKPAAGEKFVRVKASGPADDGAAKLTDELDEALKAPWKAEQYPAAAKWLEGNRGALNLVAKASERERLYVPMTIDPTMKPPMLTGVLLPELSWYREAARALGARALLRLGAGDFEGFRADSVAVHRLGRLARQGPTLIHKLVGIAVEGLGASVVQRAAAGEALTAAQARALMADLAALPPAGSVVDAMDRAERFTTLEVLGLVAVYGPGVLGRIQGAFDGGAGGEEELKPAVGPHVHDWDAGMKRVNAFYDRYVAAHGRPTHRERMTGLAEVEKEIEAARARTEGPLGLLAPIEDRLLGMLMPALVRVVTSETRAATTADLTRLGLALRAYRATEGRYPARLGELLPGYVEALPQDAFVQAPLIYHPRGEAYVLYSQGPNGEDDGGETGRGKDDIAVRGGK